MEFEESVSVQLTLRVDWLAMDDDDITQKFPILLEGILQDVYSQRAASAWQGVQPQKLTVSMLLPGTSSAAEWRDLLQSRRQFWPTLTTRHASLVPVSAEALQRERRQMQAKHLWYNVDIRWSDLKDKLEVLVPTGLTRDDIWRHLFLTKQRKNPYEEGCYTGEDVEDVKQKWEDKKHYFEQYKKDVPRPPCIDLERAILGFNIDNSAAFFRQLMTQKLYTHVDGRPRKVRTALRGEPFLMYETRLSRMIMQLPPAQMANRDGDAGMETMLWDINIIPNELDNGYLMLPPEVLHMSALGRFGRFTLFSPRVSHSKHLRVFVLCCVLGLGVFCCFVVFVFPVLQGVWNPEFSAQLDLDDRQGFIASSAMQQKKKIKGLGPRRGKENNSSLLALHVGGIREYSVCSIVEWCTSDTKSHRWQTRSFPLGRLRALLPPTTAAPAQMPSAPTRASTACDPGGGTLSQICLGPTCRA